jgi:hypothetical protein
MELAECNAYYRMLITFLLGSEGIPHQLRISSIAVFHFYLILPTTVYLVVSESDFKLVRPQKNQVAPHICWRGGGGL